MLKNNSDDAENSTSSKEAGYLEIIQAQQALLTKCQVALSTETSTEDSRLALALEVCAFLVVTPLRVIELKLRDPESHQTAEPTHLKQPKLDQPAYQAHVNRAPAMNVYNQKGRYQRAIEREYAKLRIDNS